MTTVVFNNKTTDTMYYASIAVPNDTLKIAL